MGRVVRSEERCFDGVSDAHAVMGERREPWSEGLDAVS